MTDPRGDFDIVLLPDGRVLVAGGTNNFVDTGVGALSSAEVYDPIADTWTPLPPMHDCRLWPTLAVLSDGVYVAGGLFSSGTGPGSATVLASVERLAWSELGITEPDPIGTPASRTDLARMRPRPAVRRTPGRMSMPRRKLTPG